MGSAASSQRMTATEYLAWESTQRDKHEYDRGDVFAMAGGSPRHNFLAAAITAELRAAVRDHGCQAFSSDQRVSARRGERYVYPDAVIVCGKLSLEPGTSDVLANPTVVVEVLSQGTEAYDRGAKWEAYQDLASLTDYVLVSQSSARIEHFAREAREAGATTEEAWRYRVLGPGETLTLSNGAKVPVDAVYDGAFALDAG